MIIQQAEQRERVLITRLIEGKTTGDIHRDTKFKPSIRALQNNHSNNA